MIAARAPRRINGDMGNSSTRSRPDDKLDAKVPPEGPYHRTRPPSGRQTVVPTSAPTPTVEELGTATSELEDLLGKHMRALQLRLEHNLLASSSAEITRARLQASKEEQRARSAEDRALALESEAARLARKSLWRGLGAIVASVASISSLVVVAVVSRSMRSYIADDTGEAKAITVESAEQLEQLEQRLNAETERQVGELRDELRSELALQFGALREELERVRPPVPPPAPRKRKSSP